MPGINLIYGPNAQGKTTILEAISLLITGRSFRTARFSELIQQGEPAHFQVEAAFIKHGVEQRLSISQGHMVKKIVHNQTAHPSFTPLLGLIPGVILHPEDIALVKGAPALRRRYLDDHLAQIDPLYVHFLMRYYRALHQRNAQLRRKSMQALEGWEEEMSRAAAYIVLKREEMLSEIETHCTHWYGKFTESSPIFCLTYQGNGHSHSEKERYQHYLASYERERLRDLKWGHTSTGPHREDFSLTIDNKDAKHFASEGEQRTLAAALRLAEWERLNQRAEAHPLLLIDDIGVGLDACRLGHFLESLPHFHQVFLTSTRDLDLSASYRLVLRKNG